MNILKGKERKDDLVELARFNDAMVAYSVRSLLESHGIKANVSDEQTNAVLGSGSQSLIPVKVFVFRSDLAEAEIIMNQVPAAAEIMIPQWTCSCGNLVDEGFSVCWSCGDPWPIDKSNE